MRGNKETDIFLEQQSQICTTLICEAVHRKISPMTRKKNISIAM